MKMLPNISFTTILLVCATVVSTQDINITIPLNKATIYRDKQLFDGFLTLNRSSILKVNFSNKRSNLSFIIFQVHSHLYNITLYKNAQLENSTIRGTNLGLHSNMESDLFFVKNSHENVDLKLYVAVHGYLNTDPIPGGCNMELPVPISPFMTAIYNRDYIYVDIAPAGYDYLCQQSDEEHINVNFYMLYLPEQNHESDVYFEGIQSMTSLRNILRNGRLIPKTNWNTRRMVSAYLGTGTVYVAVASVVDQIGSNTSYSVYVPTTNYGCAPNVEDDCDLIHDSFSKFVCACVFFVGLFICYFGHRFFKTQTFMIGLLSGIIVTYILVSFFLELDKPAKLAVSVVSGVFIGATRVVYWWIYGLPVFSIILSAADVGFLVAALVFYILPDDLARASYLHIDLNYWTLFILIISIVTIVLLSINFIANLICCSVIGAYATILPIDYYLGSNMKYILVNIERRATVTNYNRAVKMTTFQTNDWVLTFVWLGLAVSGFIFQYYQNKGRPPFPPPPRSVRAAPEEPATPGTSTYRRLDNEPATQSLPHHYTERTSLLTSRQTSYDG